MCNCYFKNIILILLLFLCVQEARTVVFLTVWKIVRVIMLSSDRHSQTKKKTLFLELSHWFLVKRHSRVFQKTESTLICHSDLRRNIAILLHTANPISVCISGLSELNFIDSHIWKWLVRPKHCSISQHNVFIYFI